MLSSLNSSHISFFPTLISAFSIVYYIYLAAYRNYFISLRNYFIILEQSLNFVIFSSKYLEIEVTNKYLWILLFI